MPRNDFLKITAHLQTPVISDERLPLDGIVFNFAMREKYGFEPSTQAGIQALTDGADKRKLMPFDVHYRNVGGQDHWYYACSFACWPDVVAEGRDHWVKRFDQQYAGIVDFGKKRGKLDVSAGKYKGYRMPVFTRHALTVTWFAVADRARLESLLKHCTNAGKKTSQGYGSILRFEVERWHADWSTHSPRGLMRGIPSERGVLIGYRPSYWFGANQTLCEVPESYAMPA